MASNLNGPLVVDFEARSVRLDGVALDLTARELAIVEFLAERRGGEVGFNTMRPEAERWSTQLVLRGAGLANAPLKMVASAQPTAAAPAVVR